MNVGEFAERLNASILTGDAGIDREIKGMYACDLLSWVMAHAGKGFAWTTVHTNLNIVAVALIAEIACIIIPEGIRVEEATLVKAAEEGIPILSTGRDSYKVCCMAYENGIY